jgi:hypothetical protein
MSRFNSGTTLGASRTGMFGRQRMVRIGSTTTQRLPALGVLSLSKLVPLLFLACVVAPSRSSATTSCPPSESAQFICGIVNSTDIVQLPKTHWAITGGKTGPGVPVGHLYLINVNTKTAEAFFPLAHNQYRQDQKLFGSCPGKPDEMKFNAEAVNVRPIGNRKFTLYVINHGGPHDFVNREARESTEIFEVDARVEKPRITWVGCVSTPPMPQSNELAVGNSVTPLPNDAFAITVNPAAALQQMMIMKDPIIGEKILKGEIPGRVMVWSPGTGWQEVPGSEMAGNHGIEASADGKWLYVTALFERGIYRLSLGRVPVDRVVIKTTFHPENIRWGDGFLYVAGQTVTSGGVFSVGIACRPLASCPFPFKVLRIDPKTLQSEELVNEPGGPLFGLATGVAKVGNELWLSTVRGTRLAVFPLKEAATAPQTERNVGDSDD